MKTLVVYYSRKGYAKKAAYEIAEGIDADFLSLDAIDDTDGWDGFHNCAKAAIKKREMVLFPYDADVSMYDKVIICTPIWMGGIASPVRTFVNREKHNIDTVEYVFVHLLPINCQKIAESLDKILRIEREKYTDIECVFGHTIKKSTFSESEENE